MVLYTVTVQRAAGPERITFRGPAEGWVLTPSQAKRWSRLGSQQEAIARDSEATIAEVYLSRRRTAYVLLPTHIYVVLLGDPWAYIDYLCYLLQGGRPWVTLPSYLLEMLEPVLAKGAGHAGA